MNGSPNLTGRQVERLRNAMLGAYNIAKLTELVAFRFQPPEGTPVPVPPVGPLGSFTVPPYTRQVLELVEKAEEEGWTDALVHEAHLYVPGNYTLKSFHDEYFGSVQRQVPGHALQRIVDETNSFLQPAIWREKLERLEPTVCCIEVSGQPRGTGFLVAPSVVLTNHHVIADVSAGLVPLDQVACRFDYKRLGNNLINGGVVYALSARTPLAASPPSQADAVVDPASLGGASTGAPKTPEAQTDALDYAFVRLSADAGSDVVEGRRRGFVPGPTPAPHDFAQRTTLNVLQHPQGRPLELALGPTAVIRRNAVGTRVTYRTNTEGGSSGSPCFDKDWNLVALHHSGDPDFKRSAEYNEGIPIHTIRGHLAADFRSELGW